MKVVHIESGLGNQMLSYCEYLALKKVNPYDEFYIETIIYDIPECNEVICQWNGYELERIFGIKEPKNVRTLFVDEQWQDIMIEIRQSEFWKRNWNYPVYFTKAFNYQGMKLENRCGDFEAVDATHKTTLGQKSYQSKVWFMYLNHYRRMLLRKNVKQEKNYEPELFLKTNDDIFTGQKLLFKYTYSGIERIAEDIRKVFRFPSITETKNQEMMDVIRNSQSVAIHARRGDMISYNFDCYVGGYFKRCVKYIKEQVTSPLFIFFCDPNSVLWVTEHAHVFGLNKKKDRMLFVDWNKGADSWRDMQLMAECKHQIITRSSFGWWGAWLNENPNKITCSPDININTTHHF